MTKTQQPHDSGNDKPVLGATSTHTVGDLDGKPTRVGKPNGKPRRLTKKNDWENICLLVAYDTQCRGQATVADIYHDLTTKLNVAIAEKMVSAAADALQAAQVLAESHDPDGVRVLKMRRYNFNRNPELAEYDKVISELRNDSTGELILQSLRKEPTKAKAAWPSEPADYLATVLLLKPMLGGHIWAGNQELQRNYFTGVHHTLHTDENGKELRDKDDNLVMREAFRDHTETPLILGRTWEGKLEPVHAACVRGAFRDAAQAMPPTAERAIRATDIARFFGVQDVVVDVKPTVKGLCPLTISRLPTMRTESGPDGRGGAAGPAYFEAIPGGTVLTIKFSAPTKDFIPPEEMKRWMSRFLPQSTRGLSHARGNSGYGRMELLGLTFRLWSTYNEGFVTVE